jgi:hypothetical protein
MKYKVFAGRFILFLLAFLISVPNLAVSADVGPKKDGRDIKSRTEDTEALLEAVRKRDKAIENLLQRVEMLEREVRSLRENSRANAAPRSDAAGSSVSANVTEPAAEQSPSSPVQPSWTLTPEQKEEEEREAITALERLLIDKSALLLPVWTAEFAPNFTYSHSSSDRVLIDGLLFGDFLAIGTIISERQYRDSFIPAFNFRLGLPWEMQAEARFPFRYESGRVLKSNIEEQYLDSYGLGDIELAISRQIVRDVAWFPDLIGSVRWRTTSGDDSADLPLGTGFNGLQFGVFGVETFDPVAFFGGLSYTYNFPDEKFGFDVDPGDTWGWNLGLALALNPETSINFQWDQRYTGRATANNQLVPGTALTVGNFRVGFTYALSRDVSLDMGVAIGITEDAPDMQFTVALPFRLR